MCFTMPTCSKMGITLPKVLFIDFTTHRNEISVVVCLAGHVTSSVSVDQLISPFYNQFYIVTSQDIGSDTNTHLEFV